METTINSALEAKINQFERLEDKQIRLKSEILKKSKELKETEKKLQDLRIVVIDKVLKETGLGFGEAIQLLNQNKPLHEEAIEPQEVNEEKEHHGNY